MENPIGSEPAFTGIVTLHTKSQSRSRLRTMEELSVMLVSIFLLRMVQRREHAPLSRKEVCKRELDQRDVFVMSLLL